MNLEERTVLGSPITLANLEGLYVKYTRTFDMPANASAEYAQSVVIPTLIFDVDGVIFEYDGWLGIDHYGEPIQEMIDCINKLYDSGKYQICIWSTRTNPHVQGYTFGELKTRLQKQLEGRVKYHKILSEPKPLFYCLIDDNAVNPDRIKAMRLYGLLEDGE